MKNTDRSPMMMLVDEYDGRGQFIGEANTKTRSMNSRCNDCAKFGSKQTPQIIYAVACYGGWIIAFTKAFPLIDRSPTIALYHKTLCYFVLLPLCVLSWRYAATTSPGIITKESIQRYDNYHYDEMLYKSKDNISPTLQIRKLARSKYCRYTNALVSKFDHHCFVLNQTIGEENYRYFIMFLLVHTLICGYGSIALMRLLWGEFLNVYTGTSLTTATKTSTNMFMIVVLVIKRMVAVAMFVDPILVALLAVLMALTFILMSFLGFHLCLISNGMTTNEYYKWKQVARAHAASSNNAPRSGLMPLNTYNIGMLANFMEVVFPRSKKRH